MNNRERAKQLHVKYPDVFRCPICRDGLRPDEAYSLVCQNRHTFDIARNGSVHLHPQHKPQVKYTRSLFAARQSLCQNGFFAGLIQQITSIGLAHLRHLEDTALRVLDAGCGEGSHLAQCITAWQTSRGGELLGVGVDLAKEAIHLAAKSYPGLLWSVADLSNCPLQDRQFHLILNIFSPANYAEMFRLLQRDGLLLKVVPGADYLVELRELFYRQTEKQRYSNERMIAHFQQHFSQPEVTHVRYRQPLQPGELAQLIRMTPLSWGVEEDELDKACQSGLTAVTVDAVILSGKAAYAVGPA
ncbi:putative RNA methyltransferase [Brevibacillus marinus]|uniref:putative RNA methyltransferase n=1 Tax=Brevibacillus marinus TaxID=2496837 RepID=UPI000F84D458|nr:methyltransferase domain-containing protein [Brevibacillus marinus]